tara:strand:+ start:56 stop:361 length:306 start_codon:yes stop_codon:yes gene_type:complete
MNTLNPKCILTNRDLSYSNSGHILPCCWVNTQFNDKYIKHLFKDNLHIDNNDTIEDIVNSKEWKEFMNVLKNNSDEDLPKQCKIFCSVKLEDNFEETKEKF